MLVPVILSGGSGTRLWPLSRSDRPKQFAALADDMTLLRGTVERVMQIPQVSRLLVVGSSGHVPLLAKELSGLDVQTSFILEPEGRNTAPAAAAAAHAVSEATLLILPSDHLIEDTAAFVRAAIRASDLAADGYLTTFGVVPTRPETGYGYIRRGEELAGGGFAVAEFVEKPDAAAAANYLAGGKHYWNSGMFAFTAGTYLEELSRHAPDIAEGVAGSVAVQDDGSVILGPEFGAVRAESIDYALMEKTDRAATVPLDAGWSDVGSWETLWELGTGDEAGNVTEGSVVTIDASGNYALSSGRIVALLGVDDLVVVETTDAVLVCHRDQAQGVKELVELLRRDHPGVT